MPRSSRHKSHKRSSKDEKEYDSDSEEDVKVKERERSGKEEKEKVSRVSEHSGEKRKHSREGKETKDPSGYGNGDASEEHASSKRRKERGDGGDRWNDSGDGRGTKKESRVESSRIDFEKAKEIKGLGDSKSRSSKRHESLGEKEEVDVVSVEEKDENKSGSKVESKRKSEKDSGRWESKDSKEKDRGEKRGQEFKRQDEVKGADSDLITKLTKSGEVGEDKQNKLFRENTEDELDKELERRSHKRRDDSTDKVRYEHSSKEGDERRLSSRSDRAKDDRHRYERHRDEEYGDKHLEDGDKGVRLKDAKYQEDEDKDYKQRDDKHREGNNRDTSRRNDRYDQEVDKDNGRKEDWYYEDDDRYDRRREDKYQADCERDGADKYREGGERENKLKDVKPSEDCGKERRRNYDRYREDGERHDKQRDNKYREEGERSSRSRHKEEKYRDVGDSRHSDSQRGDDLGREKPLKEAKYGDEYTCNRAGDNSDAKRPREDRHAADFPSRRSSTRGSSPGYDDRVSRYKDDLGRRRPEDREDTNDGRFRSTKDHPTDLEKRPNNSARIDMASDRGKSMVRTADVERTSIHGRHRGSPVNSSHTHRDPYRLSKQDEVKHRDYAYDERSRYSVYSGRDYVRAAGVEKMSSQSMEALDQKDENNIAELSAQRHLKTDAHTSPMKLADKSPSSVSKQFDRSDIRQSLDVEESAKRSGGSFGAKDFSSKGGKGSEFPIEMLPGDEFSQADGDTLSVSSPVVRANHRSGTLRSLLPPPHVRSSSDGPSMFGSYEDDNRNKSNHRYRRSTDSNMGRMQGNAWKGIPNWPSHMPNGFMPFQHGPPPVGFHPAMHQFPTPPIFGVRPSMELNHPLVPFHLPNADRFSGHGPPVGWQNSVDDLCPPLHGWEANNTIFSEESHHYARLDWERNKNPSGVRGWEIGRDTLKRPNRGSSVELTSILEKELRSARSPGENTLSGGSIQQAQHEQHDLRTESISITQSDDTSARTLSEHSKTICIETPIESKQSTEDDTLYQVYLSKLDISPELTESQLYDHFVGLTSVNEDITIDMDDSNFLYLEDSTVPKLSAQNKMISSSFFCVANDSVLKKAMSFYIKEREHISKGNRVQFSSLKEPILAINEEKLDSKVGKAEFFTSDGRHGADDTPQTFEQEVELVGPQKVEGPLLLPLCQEIEEPVINVSVKQEEAALTMCMDVDLAPAPNVEVEAIGEVHLASPENVEPVAKVEEITTSGDTADKIGEVKFLDTKSGPSLFSNVSSEACEANVPESDDQSGSIIVSRIHHSPESTH